LNRIVGVTFAWALVVGAIVVALAFGYGLVVRCLTRWRERRWRPTLLQQAKLEFSEKIFVAKASPPLGAKVDRAYRLTNGWLALAEFKSRSQARVYASDIVELSVQKAAIEGAGSNRVSQTGYVVIEHPHTKDRTTVPVQLLSRDAVWTLARRHRALLSGTVSAQRTQQTRICASCSYRIECRQAHS
jgi:hypothetical protein